MWNTAVSRSLICVSCGSEEPQVEESLSGLIGRVNPSRKIGWLTRLSPLYIR